MKNRKKFWIPLMMIVVVEVLICLQVTGYVLAINRNSEGNFGYLYQSLLDHHNTFNHLHVLLCIALIQMVLLLGAIWLIISYLHQYEHRAFHDSLTGLPNRWYVELHLKWACSRALAHHYLVILAFIDLNEFKPINDTLGHNKGDDVLKCIAENLRANCRSNDMAFRYGGDEFIVVFITPANKGRQSLERLKKLIQTTFCESCQFNELIGFGAAVGISIFPSLAKTPEMLIQTADRAMYHAKKLAKAGEKSLMILEYDKEFDRDSERT